MDDTLNEFVIGNSNTVKTIENEDLKSDANGHHEDFEKIVDSASQNQVIGSNNDNRKRNAVDNVVIAVENRLHEAILTAMNIVVIPWVEMAVRSITGSSENGPNSIVQNSDRTNLTVNAESTPLRSACSLLDLNIEQNEIDETRDVGNSEDGDIPATRFTLDGRAQAHHSQLHMETIK